MSASPEQHDRQLDEREIRSLSDQSGLASAEVRTLFRRERARLGIGAKVHSYLAVLTASNVRAMLQRTAKRRVGAQEWWKSGQAPHEPSNGYGDAALRAEEDRPWRDLPGRSGDTTRDVQSWEDDGGSVRAARCCDDDTDADRSPLRAWRSRS